MSNKYQLLADLEELRKNGTISEEEYQSERAKIMGSNPQQTSSDSSLGMDEKSYLLLMHLSQFAGFLIPFAGFAVPVVMWAINKDKNENVDKHGKNILNFIISWCIYYTISVVLIFVIIGIPLLIVLGIFQLIFTIVAAVKANSGEYWKYPMTIPFFS